MIHHREKVAVVVQRWHESIAGGSENHAFQYAGMLRDFYSVDLITTTALSSLTWRNELQPGESENNGIRVLRFRVSGERTADWEKLHRRLLLLYNAYCARPDRSAARGLTELDVPVTPWSIALQEEWIRRQGPHSGELLEYITRHQKEYSAIIFVTYLYSPVYFGLQIAESCRSLFVPTLHDEPPAYLPVFRFMAQRAGRVLWNTEPERELGRRLWGDLPGSIVAMGIQTEPAATADRIRKEDPCILYAGRVDRGKGCDQLIDFFRRFQNENVSPLKLVLMGPESLSQSTLHTTASRLDGIRHNFRNFFQKFIAGNSFARNSWSGRHSADDIIAIGTVSEEEKFARMAGARVFVMPSPLESLGVATLEAMACSTPVLANGQNPVLRHHVQKSGGGMLYYDYSTFAANLQMLGDNPNLCDKLGQAGRKYVVENYSMDTVRKKLFQEVDRVVENNRSRDR